MWFGMGPIKLEHVAGMSYICPRLSSERSHMALVVVIRAQSEVQYVHKGGTYWGERSQELTFCNGKLSGHPWGSSKECFPMSSCESEAKSNLYHRVYRNVFWHNRNVFWGNSSWSLYLETQSNLECQLLVWYIMIIKHDVCVQQSSCMYLMHEQVHTGQFFW